MQEATAKLEWILEDRNRIWLHLLFWVFIYLDEILGLLGVTRQGYVQPGLVASLFVMDVLTVYFNLYVLISTYLIVGKVWMYLAFTVITVFINIEFGFLLRYNFFDGDVTQLPDNSVISQLISDFAFTTFMLGTAIGAHMLRRNVRNQKRIRMLETEKLSTELKFLKNQINPHFLFNSLNNIYVLTRTRRQKASESVLLLSDLLRYQLYDCARDQVKLKDEVQYLQNYLELERLRKSRAEITYDFEGNPGNHEVAPFLFIPFIENAVKHGGQSDGTFYIHIRFHLKGTELYFEIRNSKGDKGGAESQKRSTSGGIGLQNVKRRLELVYPNQYDLNIKEDDSVYCVQLTLKLDS